MAHSLLKIFGLVFVGMLWGVTNPLLKKYSKGVENLSGSGFLQKTFQEVSFLVGKPKYVASFLLNQAASVLFVISLGSVELALAIPLVNSLTFLFTMLAGHYFLKEESFGRLGCCGVAFVCIGLGLCISATA